MASYFLGSYVYLWDLFLPFLIEVMYADLHILIICSTNCLKIQLHSLVFPIFPVSLIYAHKIFSFFFVHLGFQFVLFLNSSDENLLLCF